MFRLKTTRLSLIVFFFDLSAVAIAWLAAYLVRFNGEVPQEFKESALWALVWVLPIHGLAFRILGLYRGIWVFASLPDLLRIVRAVVASTFAVIIGAAMLQPDPIIPRSVFIVAPIFLFLIMGGARTFYRTIREFYRYGGLIAQGKPVLLLGAGSAGASLVRELMRSSEWRLVGLLDDDSTKHGREIQGYKILGSINELQRWASEFKAEHVIIAMPSAPLEMHRQVTTLCVRAGSM